MSTYDNHPGGGHQEIKGYEPPAGSMADEQRRADDEQARRLRSERDDAAMRTELEASQRTSSGTTARTGQKTQEPQQARSNKGDRTRARPPGPPRPPRPWHPLFGIVGFIVVTTWVASLMDGENKWLLAVAAGLFGGFVIGKLYKIILALAAVGLGLFLWSRISNGPGREDDLGASFEYTPLEQPDYVPAPISGRPTNTDLGVTVQPLPDIDVDIPGVATSSSDAGATASVKETDIPPLNSDGLLFEVGSEVGIRYELLGGKPHALTVHHEKLIPYDALSHIEYHALRGYMMVEGVQGGRAGMRIPDDMYEIWRYAPNVTLARTVDGKVLDQREFPLIQVPSID